MAGPTRLELATSTVTVWRSNQLSYGPFLSFKSPETVPGVIASGKAGRADPLCLTKCAINS